MKRNKVTLSISLVAALLFATDCSANSTASSSSSTESSKSMSTAEGTTASSIGLDVLELPQLTKDVAENEDLIEMVTNKGTTKIRLFPEHVPKVVEGFVTHAKDGYYNGLAFHRIIKDFMIQGGDPKGDGTGGESIWGEGFETKINNHLYDIRGALSMARSQDPDGNGSQFFIIQNTDDMHNGLLKDDYPQAIIDTCKNGGYPSLDGHYTVFGQVVEGMNVVDAIANIETDSSDKPEEEVKIDKINILQEAEQK